MPCYCSVFSQTCQSTQLLLIYCSDWCLYWDLLATFQLFWQQSNYSGNNPTILATFQHYLSCNIPTLFIWQHSNIIYLATFHLLPFRSTWQTASNNNGGRHQLALPSIGADPVVTDRKDQSAVDCRQTGALGPTRGSNYKNFVVSKDQYESFSLLTGKNNAIKQLWLLHIIRRSLVLLLFFFLRDFIFKKIGILSNLSFCFLSWENCCTWHDRYSFKGLLDRNSFASQLATQMQMERLHPKIEMLFAIQHCWVPCIYAQESQLCGAAAVCCQRS